VRFSASGAATPALLALGASAQGASSRLITVAATGGITKQ
jgi:hypothetical protein